MERFLNTMTEKPSLKELFRIGVFVANGMDYLQRHAIVHRRLVSLAVW